MLIALLYITVSLTCIIKEAVPNGINKTNQSKTHIVWHKLYNAKNV